MTSLHAHDTAAEHRPVVDVPGSPGGRSGANTGLNLRRPKRVVETPELLQGVRRILASLAVRVGESDTEALRLLVELRADVEQTITEAIRGLRNDPAVPASWAEIGDALSVTPQAAQQRYGHVGGRRRRGGQPANLR